MATAELAHALWIAAFAVVLALDVRAQSSVTLAWDPSTSSGVTGYRLYWGGASGNYTNTVSTGTATTTTAANLVPGGTYFFAVTAVDSTGLESDFSNEIRYTVPVVSNSPPTIALTSPAGGASYTAPATISLAASVVANGHTITRVQFYNGGTSLATVSSGPFSYTWSSVSAGTYSLSASVTYDSGSTVSSPAVTVIVGTAPAVSGVTFAADSGTYSAPFVASGGMLSQPTETGLSTGGRAVYSFNITNAGNYLVSAMVIAPNTAQNSFWVNIDAEPTDPLMIWDIPISSVSTSQTVSWRGTGNSDPATAQYSPKVFYLTAGTHQLIIRGREANTKLGTITIAARPTRVRIRRSGGYTGSGSTAQPTQFDSIIVGVDGQPGVTYTVLASQDLRTWTSIGTLKVDDTGSGEISDPAGVAFPARYYRLAVITPTAPSLQISAAPGGSVILSGTGQPGQVLTVLASQNLKTWGGIGTVTIGASGSFTFVDPDARTRSSRLYRLQAQ